MKKLLSTILIFLAVYATIAQDKQDAQLAAVESYVTDLRKLRDEYIIKCKQFEKDLQERNMSAAEANLNLLQTQVYSSITKLRSMEGYKGETGYRGAIMDFLQYIQVIVDNDLVELIDLYKLQHPTDADTRRVDEISANIASESGRRLVQIEQAEKAFGEKYYVRSEAAQFCGDIKKLLESAEQGFVDLKGKKDANSLFADRYKAKLMPLFAGEGWIEDWYFPQAIYTYYRGNDYAVAQNYLRNLGNWINSCELGWTRKEDIIAESVMTTTKGSTIKFIEKEEGKTGRAVKLIITKPVSGYTVQVIINNYGLKH